MNDKKVKITVRITKLNSEALKIIAKEKNSTVTNMVNESIAYYINNLKDTNDYEVKKDIIYKLENIENGLVDLKKKNIWLTNLVKQIFVNSGFPKNRNVKDDLVFQEYIKKTNDELA